MSLRQSFAWWSVARGVSSPQDFLRAARTIGYDAVELIPETLWPAVRDAGLAVSAAGGHESISSGLNRRENHPRIRREVEAKLRLAERWNVPNLICFSGNRDGQGDTTGAEVTAEGLAPLAPLAQSVGVTLVLELLNSRVDHPDYQCDRTGWGAGVVDRVGSPSVKLLYDVYHAQVMEGDLVRTIREHHERIGHYHTAGNPGRHELDDAQEIGYPAVFRAIRETGFEGYVAHEFLPTRDPLAGLKEAFDLVERSSEGR